MIPVQGTGGPGFNSRIAPFYTMGGSLKINYFLSNQKACKANQQYLSYTQMITPYCSLLAVIIIFTVRVQCKQNQYNSTFIYGVRWFLGEMYRFQDPITIQERNTSKSHLVLFFNTHKTSQTSTFSVKIDSVMYECDYVEVVTNLTERHHAQFNEFASNIGQIFTTYVHKCPFLFQNELFLEKHSTFGYFIYEKYSERDQIIFQSNLRSPSYLNDHISITVFGDWGLMSNFSKQSHLSQPITDCLMQQINQNHNIRLMLLLGDLAYDLQGQTYVNFFTYLQPFSQNLVILFSPGNHETIKHKDLYQLIKQSFYSPHWSAFYGYFDIIQIKNYVFIGYNTEGLFPGLSTQSNSSLYEVQLEDQYGEYYNLFAMQLPTKTKIALKDRTVIGYSHYPTYCSEEDRHQSCNDYRSKHEPYLHQLQQIGMNIFFSGHLHVYERSKQICRGGAEVRSGRIDDEHFEYNFDDNCSIFVVQGAAGNNYFVQSNRHFELQSHSEKYIDNTGFGVLTLNLSGDGIRFRHIIVDKCRVADELFIGKQNKSIYADQQIGGSNRVTSYYAITIIVVISLLIYGLARFIKKKKIQASLQRLSAKSHANVLEMAQSQSLN